MPQSVKTNHFPLKQHSKIASVPPPKLFHCQDEKGFFFLNIMWGYGPLDGAGGLWLPLQFSSHLKTIICSSCYLLLDFVAKMEVGLWLLHGAILRYGETHKMGCRPPAFSRRPKWLPGENLFTSLWHKPGCPITSITSFPALTHIHKLLHQSLLLAEAWKSLSSTFSYLKFTFKTAGFFPPMKTTIENRCCFEKKGLSIGSVSL